ncbi:MAG: AMP-binding protein, partial [Solirubrobacteraceae bacterium]
AARGGFDLIMLNTSFSARQCAEVADREGVDLLVYDAELAAATVDVRAPRGRFAVTLDDPDADELDRLTAEGATTLPPAPTRAGRIVILTSGTTGTPKGAPRADPRGFVGVGAMLERLPMRTREVTVVAPPLFHGTGLLIALLSLALGSKLVVRRRFDAAQMLDDIATHCATAVCVVPIMLQRMLALGQHEIGARDLSSLRIVFCAGSSLPPKVGLATMDALGEVVYNLYATTEVALATMATPADVRAEPTDIGRQSAAWVAGRDPRRARAPAARRPDRPDLRRQLLTV